MACPSSTRVSGDLVICELADSEAALRDRIWSLEDDVRIYRDLARSGIHALHDVVAERERLREQLSHLRNEYRALRERSLSEDAA